jgi:hypothetical protein
MHGIYNIKHVLFANNSVLINSAPPPLFSIYVYTYAAPGESLQILWPSCMLTLASPVVKYIKICCC